MILFVIILSLLLTITEKKEKIDTECYDRYGNVIKNQVCIEELIYGSTKDYWASLKCLILIIGVCIFILGVINED